MRSKASKKWCRWEQGSTFNFWSSCSWWAMMLIRFTKQLFRSIHTHSPWFSYYSDDSGKSFLFHIPSPQLQYLCTAWSSIWDYGELKKKDWPGMTSYSSATIQPLSQPGSLLAWLRGTWICLSPNGSSDESIQQKRLFVVWNSLGFLNNQDISLLLDISQTCEFHILRSKKPKSSLLHHVALFKDLITISFVYPMLLCFVWTVPWWNLPRPRTQRVSLPCRMEGSL